MLKKLFSVLVWLCVLSMTALPIFAQDDLPAASDLPVGEWSTIEPGGDTICSLGTPFSFFVRPAEVASDKLLIYFQGGGACWFGDICNVSVNPTYDPFVDGGDVPLPGGIFDYANPENPFVDYNTVFVPYCTADVHIGNAVREYESSAGPVTIYHNGYNNAMTVLNWTFANFENPETVFVTGSSAGSIPSPFYAEFVAEAYPEARIEVLGDGAGGYRVPLNAPITFGAWGTMSILTDLYEAYTVDNLSFEAFYIEVGKAYPQISMTQYNTAADATQIRFLLLSGVVGVPLIELLELNFADIQAEVDTFAHFLAGGELHTILGRPQLYTYAVGGIRLIDWLTALANGEDVETVACAADACALPEEVGGQ